MFSSSTLKRYLLPLLLAVVGLFSAKPAQASHYSSVDMYVDYIGTGLGNYKYRVTLITYSLCEPNQASLPCTEQVCIKSSCYPTPIYLTLDGLPPGSGFNCTEDTLDQLCAFYAPNNTCRQPGSQYPGFKRKILQDTITLPGPCIDWKFSWGICCRVSTITNHTNTSGAGSYIAVGLNNVEKYNNSSPRYTSVPIPYICINQPANYLNTPVDPNNDSMRSGYIIPQDGSSCDFSNTLPFASNFSATNPIAASVSNPWNVNVASGNATFTPTVAGNYFLAFQTNEYDRFSGVQLGYIQRDVTVVVLNCNGSPPTVDTTPLNIVNGNLVGPNTIAVCPGNNINFLVTATSNSISNTVNMYSNNGIAPGSTFTVSGNGGPNPQGVFSWTPTGAQTGDYVLVITVADSTCSQNQPIVLKNYLVVVIKVMPGIDAGPDGIVCGLPEPGSWQLQANGPPNIPFTWRAISGGSDATLSCTNCPNPIATPIVPTYYELSTPPNPEVCKILDTVFIDIDRRNSIDATPDEPFILCRPDYLQLNSVVSGPKPLRNVVCGTANPILCATPDSSIIGNGVASNNTNITPYYGGSYRTARSQMLIRRSELTAAGMAPGTIRSMSLYIPGFPTPFTYQNFRVSVLCTSEEALSTATSFVPGATLVYSSNSVTPVNGWNEYVFNTPYNWDSSKNLIVEICYNASGTPPTSNVQFTATPFTSFLRTAATSGNLCGGTASGFFTTAQASRPNIKFRYCEAGDADFPYTWVTSKNTPYAFLSDSNIANPLAYVPQTSKWYVYSRGLSKCLLVDSVTVFVPNNNFDVYPKDTAICAGQSFRISTSDAGANNETYTWYEPGFTTPTTLSCTDCPVTVATPTQDVVYTLVVADSVNCTDTFNIPVIVKPLPIVDILQGDTLIKYGQTVNLRATGANLYYWAPTTGLSAGIGTNITASPTETTEYIVSGLAANGCRGYDSVTIRVDPTDNLFVPSAFSPNGDARNDVFKVSNFTFQKLIEFRVYNRFGQEIFSTTDGRKGWDGTWKGVPQDMGVYQYIIRVAFPDGIVETYKGDVTLIR